MGATTGDPLEMQDSLARLADLLLFRERFSEDPRAALESYGLRGVPDAAVEAIARLSPEELQVFAQVQRKLADVPLGNENCLLF